MRVAALYDVHGNLPALEAVLAEVRDAAVDEIVVGGDVLPGPFARESLERLASLDVPVRYLHGNGEREVLAVMRGLEPTTVPERFRDVIRWTARQLSQGDERFLSTWPPTLRVPIPPLGDVLFCHATPRNDIEVFTRSTPEAAVLPAFAGLPPDVALAVCGHTHMQFDRTIGRIRVVNAGSVGMPFGSPGAYWLLLGPGVELRRTEYDLAAAAGRLSGTGYPNAAEFAAKSVVAPPSEDAMIAAFARAELK